MKIVEFPGNTLRFLDELPPAANGGFVWIYLSRESLERELPTLQKAAQSLGGSPLLDLHLQDLRNASHPSRYDYTSVYDLLVFRRLATEDEVRAEATEGLPAADAQLATFARIRSRAVGFVVFDRLLISVHPEGCYTAAMFIKRFLSDAVTSEGLSTAGRSRLPLGPADLMLRMVNVMVDSYLELRGALNSELDAWQGEMLSARSGAADWRAFMSARKALHSLEDLSEGQNDAMQEWLDTLREHPPSEKSQAERDGLVARARDVIEHVQRVVRHARRMEQGAETAVQIHFSVQGNRTNETMRMLTALTAIFLPLNLITGFFGMNFEFLPFIRSAGAMWGVFGLMAMVAITVVAVFWRKRYLERTK